MPRWWVVMVVVVVIVVVGVERGGGVQGEGGREGRVDYVLVIMVSTLLLPSATLGLPPDSHRLD